MKITEPIKGFTRYRESDYTFTYENSALELMPISMQNWHEESYNRFKEAIQAMDSQGKSWIGCSYINAVTHRNNNIIFYVRNNFTNDNGFLNFCVLYLYEYEREIDNNCIDGFILTGREINSFYNPAKIHNISKSYEDGKQKFINTKTRLNNEKVLGSYKYNDIDITISVNTVPTFHIMSHNPLNAQSSMVFTFSKRQSLKFTINVLKHCRCFFFYICERTNIQFNEIQVFNIENHHYKLNGSIKLCFMKHNDETDINQLHRIIKYRYLKEKVCLLFSAIATDTMYFEHLCPSIKAKDSFGINRIILNFVAFEREFRNIYDDSFVRSKEYTEIKDEVIQYLKELKESNTGNKKRYIKSFIKGFEKQENSYADRMKKALNDCKDILLPFLEDKYKDFEIEMINDISERLGNIRNDVAHGNIDLVINPINILDFYILECLLYAMRLNYIGIETVQIKNAINDLKNSNVLIE